jgi:kynurenine formamidase
MQIKRGEGGEGARPDPVAVLAALREGTSGTLVDLSQPVDHLTPRDAEQSPYAMCMWSHPSISADENARAGAKNGIGFAVERVELDLHTGTHIDAFGHCVVNSSMHGGLTIDAVVTNAGLAELGIESAPAIVARGVLIDAPGVLGRSLESGEVITVEVIERALDRQESELMAGDVVLFRTGWAQYSRVDNDRFLAGWPGIGIDGARWLVDRGVIAVGADTHALEVWPPEEPQVHWPVHQELLVRAGVYIIEHANLEELAERGAYTFLCLCLPIRFVGGTASPIRLTAVL